MADPVLSVQGLSKVFSLGRNRSVHALSGVSLDLYPGETLAVVGESGCGKSTLGRVLMGLTAPSGGSFALEGRVVDPARAEDMKRLRRAMQMVFQDPSASLNPRVPVGTSIAEPLENFCGLSSAERMARVEALLEKVGLDGQTARRLPTEFSGGQRQRIGIARALSVSPKVIIADEAVSALDVSVQAQVLNLLADLQSELGLAYLFITHDLNVVAHVADRIAVMYLGRVVELGSRAEVLENPQHPYTRVLLEAAPVEHPRARRQRQLLRGEMPSPLDPPAGCAFHTRCPLADTHCSAALPGLAPQPGGSLVACHKAGAPVAKEIAHV